MRLFLSLSLSLLLFACTTDNTGVKLYEEAMTVHDEAMKDMGEMNRVGRELKAKVLTLDSTAADYATRKVAYDAALQHIEKAGDDMMSWMRDFKKPTELTSKNAVEYLQKAKTGIADNAADIKAAIEEGKALLK